MPLAPHQSHTVAGRSSVSKIYLNLSNKLGISPAYRMPYGTIILSEMRIPHCLTIREFLKLKLKVVIHNSFSEILTSRREWLAWCEQRKNEPYRSERFWMTMHGFWQLVKHILVARISKFVCHVIAPCFYSISIN